MRNRKLKKKQRNAKILGGFLGLALLAILVYQIPYVKTRLQWRLDGWWTAIRLTLDPIDELQVVEDRPTSLPATPTEEIESTPTPEATQPPATAAPPSPTALPASQQLAVPEWQQQDWNNCGPATLAMYLSLYGWRGDQYTISDVIKPERTDRNVNIEEMSYYVLNYAGWLKVQYRVGGDLDMLKRLLAAGFPVLIEEGDTMAQAYHFEDDLWAGHYILLTGYDDAEAEFTAQDSFRSLNRKVSYTETLERWQNFNHVYFVVYLPDQEETLKNVLGSDWDLEQNRQRALQKNEAEIKADPTDEFAWFNKGTNLVYFERYAEAAEAYDEAIELGVPQRMLRYQFGPFFAYYHSNRPDSLQSVLDYALKITPNSEEALVWQGWQYFRLGQNDKAVAAFREAYWYNPLSFDAKYALDFMGVSP